VNIGADITSVDAFLFPEWAEQDAILLAWPHPDTDWADNLEQIESTYVNLIANITRFEKVILLVNSHSLHEQVQEKLSLHNVDTANVVFRVLPYDDTWLRDTGPLCARHNNKISLHDFRFNGWGGKYDAQEDDKICERLSKTGTFTDRKLIQHDIFLEGGSIDTDGMDTILTTRQCLLSTTRNPNMREQDYEDLFHILFGTKRILWINNSELIGDDTDGHIDMLARFCNENTIAYTSCSDKSDPQYETLQNMESELASFRTMQDKRYTLVPLPIPAARHNKHGKRLPASYANFLIINKAVLVPVYDDKNDEIALDAINTCFPDREVIGIDARAAIEQFGSLHCLTMQLPKGVIGNVI